MIFNKGQHRLITLLEKDTSTSDLRLANAALAIKQAMKGKSQIKEDQQSQKRARIWTKINWLKLFILGSYMSIALFEYPSWCSQNDCQTGSKFYPMASLPKIQNKILHSLELFLLLSILALALFRKSFKKPNKKDKIRLYLLIVLVFIGFLDNIFLLVINSRLYIAQFIRPFIFIMFISQIRVSLVRIIYVVYDARAIIILIILHLVVFAWTGSVLFQGTSQEEIYFKTSSDSIWFILVLLTTANFPDIMMNTYIQNRLTCLFFVTFLTIGLFFLVKLVLAVFYNNYKAQIERSAAAFLDNRKQGLNEGFNELDCYGKGYIDSEQLHRIITILKDDLEVNPESKRLLDLIEANTVMTMNNFENLLNQINLCNQSQSDYNPFASWFPRFYSTDNKIYVNLKNVLQSAYFEASMNIVNLVNLMSEFIDDSLSYYNNEWWLYSQIGFLAIYWVQMFLKLLIQGPKSYFFSIPHLIEVLINVASILVLFIIFLPDSYNSSHFFKFCTMIRMLRIFKLLSGVKQYRIIFKTFVLLIPAFITFFGVLVVIFYCFSILGVQLFGGLIYQQKEEIVKADQVPPLYIYNNFNDFPSGLVTLFELIVVNNWQVIANMHQIVTNKWSRWFFVCFYFVSVLITVNLIVTFIIDMLNTQQEIEKQKQEGKQQQKVQQKNKEENRRNSYINLRRTVKSSQIMELWRENPR